MATRAIIKIEGCYYACIYKHWDGYPDGLLAWLESFNKDFAENRGNDPQYKFAQLLRDSVRNEKDFNLDSSRYTGWGVYPLPCGAGQGYEYTLHTNGSVTYEDV